MTIEERSRLRTLWIQKRSEQDMINMLVREYEENENTKEGLVYIGR